ncbi:DNA cytosine methyltransferase [Roseibium sp. CAU 1637]|uniref:DNA (cytosine-5-)-methyltransferase n=1 Tax=Roseibium limicola TaxID=2816037 RepID=A0A939ER70_9HYPH|nr:DNA cytosine methyltransferase [Roseibium limicola]MBO0346053.1 DNA cytosine methyltransferase [Roseibium limicola]
MPQRLNGLSLCAGVGGLELGLHVAEPGYRTVCYVEREACAAATLVARMEDQALDHAPVWDDVKSFDGRPWRGKVHILSAGYPCQPFSSSGKRRGREDPRHLWPDVARIIGESEPEWVFCENVEGHLDRGFEEVAGDFQAMGYSLKAGLFSAAEVGAAHIRKRLFILAHANNKPLLLPDRHPDRGGRPSVQDRHRPERQPARDRQCGPGLDDVLANDEGDGFEAPSRPDLPVFAPAPCDLEAWDTHLSRRLDLQPEFFGLADGLANRVERSRAAGNGVVPLAAAYAYRTLRAGYLVREGGG